LAAPNRDALELTVAGLFDNRPPSGRASRAFEHKVEKICWPRLIRFDQTEIGVESEVETTVFADLRGHREVRIAWAILFKHKSLA